MMPLRRCAALPLFALFLSTASALSAPPDHIVIVVEENRAYQQVIGDAGAPYMNSLAQNGALFTNMYALTHPSQPNYLHLFSGDSQNITGDATPTAGVPYSSANLAAALAAVGKTFVGYSQGLPGVGSLVSTAGPYARKHAPWTNWQSASPANANQLLPAVNQPFTAFPSDFSQLPTVSIVVPDLNNDMHDGTIPQADQWLEQNIGPYAAWALDHNSLLIITWDEDETNSRNRIPTIFYGPMVRTGVVDSTWTLHNLLRTVCDLYGAATPGSLAAVTRPIVGALTSDATAPPTRTLSFRQGDGGYSDCVDTSIEQAAPDAQHGGDAVLIADGSPLSQVLISFAGVVGPGQYQVRANSQVLSAKLVILTGSVVNDSSTNFMRLHRMLRSWTGQATWNDQVNGISTDNTEAAAAAGFAVLPNALNTFAIFDVTTTVQGWANDATSAQGWLINPTGTDGWRFASSEAPAVGDRPRLEITFVPPRCPADFNGDGAVSVQDLFDFLAAWFARGPGSDFNQSGTVTVQDLFDFLAAWFAPCL